MIEICYYKADDGTKFDDRWDCIQYERQKALEEFKDDFQFFDSCRNPVPIENADTEKVCYIIVKNARCAETIGNWFNDDSCADPFDGCYEEVVGTWVYGDIIDKGDEWYKLELEIEKLQDIINKINQ